VISTLAQNCRGYVILTQLGSTLFLYSCVRTAKLLNFALLYKCRFFEHAYIQNCGSGFFEDFLFDVSLMNLEQVTQALTDWDFIGFRILC
jgi:hypothetical protein